MIEYLLRYLEIQANYPVAESLQEYDVIKETHPTTRLGSTREEGEKKGDGP